MLRTSSDVTPVAGPSRKTSRATKLVQAAALAAMLVPLGTVAIEADTIQCHSTMSGGGCSGSGGGSAYYHSGGGDQWNEWDFYYRGDLMYTFSIDGVPTSNFALDVSDWVTTQAGLAGLLDGFPGWQCVPTFDVGQCGLFTVSVVVGSDPPAWEDGYSATIIWWPNPDPLSVPPDPPYVTILQAEDQDGGVFSTELQNIQYYQWEDPGVDPGISGKGTGFSTFGVFANPVPEPASLMLLGTGLAGIVYRVRRRHRQP